MWVRCTDCHRAYDDAEQWTICPHSPLGFPIDDLCPECDTLKTIHGPCRHQKEMAEIMARLEEQLGFDRDEDNSRLRILGYLALRQEKWSQVNAAVTPYNTWSEDIQNLVREGLVECQVSVEEMGPKSLVRISQGLL